MGVDTNKKRCEALQQFFSEFRTLSSFQHNSQGRLRSLAQFFSNFAKLRPALTKSTPSSIPDHRPNLENLHGFFSRLGPLARNSARCGDFMNVWELAGLKRNEVRTAAVLAWLFDPHQTHGHAAEFFLAFIRRLAKAHSRAFPIPMNIPTDYVVLKEPYLLANMESRLDIVIEGTSLVVIETKIDQAPDEQQIRDYLSLSKAKAGDRPYCLILLAPKRPTGFSIESPHFLMATWNDVSLTIEEVLRADGPDFGQFGGRVLRQFARYVSQF